LGLVGFGNAWRKEGQGEDCDSDGGRSHGQAFYGIVNCQSPSFVQHSGE